MPENKFKELCEIEPQLSTLSKIVYNPQENFLAYLMRCDVLRLNI